MVALWVGRWEEVWSFLGVIESKRGKGDVGRRWTGLGRWARGIEVTSFAYLLLLFDFSVIAPQLHGEAPRRSQNAFASTFNTVSLHHHHEESLENF